MKRSKASIITTGTTSHLMILSLMVGSAAAQVGTCSGVNTRFPAQSVGNWYAGYEKWCRSRRKRNLQAFGSCLSRNNTVSACMDRHSLIVHSSYLSTLFVCAFRFVCFVHLIFTCCNTIPNTNSVARTGGTTQQEISRNIPLTLTD